MSSQPIRVESGTLESLREQSRRTGESITRLAQRYIDEGMRMERHPRIVFRNGPAGRRAGVAGGPDVWEIVAAARTAPETGKELISALSERAGITPSRIQTAIRYYADYPMEIDELIAVNEAEAERLEQALEREQNFVG